MNATHHRIIIRIGATATDRHYTSTDLTPDAARRAAIAEATVDYGFYNVGITVTAVQVWDFETKTWVDVQEEAAPEEATPVADLTDEELHAEVTALWAGTNGGQLPYFGFFGGGPASVKSKNYLRALLKRHADTREAQVIRRVLNECRESGETISKSDVLPAIKVLKAL